MIGIVALSLAMFSYGTYLAWGWLDEREEARKELLPREQLEARPWLRNRSWRRREIVSGSPVGIGVLLLAYLAIGGPALFFIWAAISNVTTKGGESLLIPGLAMGSLLAFIVGGLTYWKLRHWRYGNSVCRLITLPGVVGGRLEVDVECALPVDADPTVVVRLKNLVPAGKRLSEVWRMEERLQVPAQAGKRTIVNVRLKIPRAAGQKVALLRPSRWDWLHGNPIWMLELEKKVPGIDFLAQFHVPVYDVPQGPSVSAPEPPLERPPGRVPSPDLPARAVAAAVTFAGAIGFIAVTYRTDWLSGGIFKPSTEWVTRERFQREFDAWSRNGYYPPAIEARCAAGSEQYRSDWKPIPRKTRFMAWYAMDRRHYEIKNREYTAMGYTLETTTRYTDCSGAEKVQATWLKR